MSLSQAGAGGQTMRPFPRGAGEQAGGKQSARARRPRGLLAGRGAAGGGARPWQGLQGGWASRAPGKRSCLDALGVLWSVFRAQLCLLHLEAGGGGETGWAGGEEPAMGPLLASGSAGVRAGTDLPAHFLGGRVLWASWRRRAGDVDSGWGCLTSRALTPNTGKLSQVLPAGSFIHLFHGRAHPAAWGRDWKSRTVGSGGCGWSQTPTGGALQAEARPGGPPCPLGRGGAEVGLWGPALGVRLWLPPCGCGCPQRGPQWPPLRNK